MKSFCSAFNVITTALSFISTSFGKDRIEDDRGVLILTHSNFKNVVNNNLVLVQFYVPWCGHCRSLAPEYQKAAQILNKKRPEIKIAKVDCSEEKVLVYINQIMGYPTLKLFIRGNVIQYEGKRSASDIADWVNEKVT